MTFTKAKTLSLSLLIPFSSFTFAGQEAVDCQSISHPSIDVFTAIDYEATFAQYPSSLQQKAQQVLTKIDNKEQDLIDVQQLTRAQDLELEALDARLEAIMQQACIEPVTVDLLAALSDTEQLKALKLWREIQLIADQLEAREESEHQDKMTSEQEQTLNAKLDKLEDILMANY